MTTQTIEDQVNGIMAGAGTTLHADGTHVAKCGAMSTLRGQGQTAETALAALRRKVERQVKRQQSK